MNPLESTVRPTGGSYKRHILAFLPTMLVKTLQVLSLEVDGLLLEVKSLWPLGMGDGLGNLHDSEKQGF